MTTRPAPASVNAAGRSTTASSTRPAEEAETPASRGPKERSGSANTGTARSTRSTHARAPSCAPSSRRPSSPRHLGRRRALARQVGRRCERGPPDRPGLGRRARTARHARQDDGFGARVGRSRRLLLRRRVEREDTRRMTSLAPTVNPRRQRPSRTGRTSWISSTGRGPHFRPRTSSSRRSRRPCCRRPAP